MSDVWQNYRYPLVSGHHDSNCPPLAGPREQLRTCEKRNFFWWLATDFLMTSDYGARLLEFPSVSFW